MSEPAFDEDGYPTPGTLRTIQHWPYTDPQGLMEYCYKAWRYADLGYWAQRGRAYKISTGGWSGNESIIDHLMDNKVFWMLCWVSSRRGGHYEFEIPKGKETPDE